MPRLSTTVDTGDAGGKTHKDFIRHVLRVLGGGEFGR